MVVILNCYPFLKTLAGDWKTVETLLVFHRELTPHRLAIISSLPECLDVSLYQIILPEIDPGLA